MKITSVLFFASASHLEDGDGEDSTFVPLKEGNYSADALLALFPGMRDLHLTARVFFFHQGWHVRSLLWKGSHLPVTWPLPRHPFEKQPQH